MTWHRHTVLTVPDISVVWECYVMLLSLDFTLQLSMLLQVYWCSLCNTTVQVTFLRAINMYDKKKLHNDLCTEGVARMARGTSCALRLMIFITFCILMTSRHLHFLLLEGRDGARKFNHFTRFHSYMLSCTRWQAYHTSSPCRKRCEGFIMISEWH